MTKKKPVGVKRRRGGISYKKVAVSVPSGLVEAVEREVHMRHAPSVSAFFSEAVEEKLGREGLDEVIDEIFRDRPITQKERKWAAKMFGD